MRLHMFNKITFLEKYLFDMDISTNKLNLLYEIFGIKHLPRLGVYSMDVHVCPKSKQKIK